MTFQPIVPASGNLGWIFLNRTREAQQDAFDNSAQVQRDTDYFRENISEIRSAEELVSDRRLLSVALSAFGLSDDIDNKFFVKKVLEDGTLAEDAFANRLTDKRYFNMAESFSFDVSPPNTVLSSFADDIINKYKAREFEVAVGNTDEDLRLALGFERELTEIADRDLSETSTWLSVMGSPPLRRVFETALGLPTQFAAIDIDRQVEVFQEKSQRTFGTSNPSDFVDPELQDDLVRNFLFRAELDAAASATTRGSVALSLLQSQPPLF